MPKVQIDLFLFLKKILATYLTMTSKVEKLLHFFKSIEKFRILGICSQILSESHFPSSNPLQKQSNESLKGNITHSHPRKALQENQVDFFP